MVDPRLLLMYEKRKAVARVAKKHRGKPPVWLHPTPIERYYAGILLSYVRLIQEQTRQLIYPALPGLVMEANNTKPVTDRADDYANNLAQMMQALSLSIDKNNPINIPTMTLDVGQKTSKWNSAQWQKTMKQVTGVNTAQYEPWLQNQLSSFSVENVALIKSIKDKSLSDIETMTQRALRSGMRHEEIARQIEGTFDTTRSRAKLIARDQVSKLNGQLTELRQKDIGISEYIWRTSGDERVRADHTANNGKKMRWDDSTVYWNGTAWVPRTGFRGIPGEDYQCRCWAEPVFDSIYESIDQGTYNVPGAVPPPPAPVSAPTPVKVPKTTAAVAQVAKGKVAKPVQGVYPNTPYKGQTYAQYKAMHKNADIETLAVLGSGDKHNLKLLWGKQGYANSVSLEVKEGMRMSNRVVVHNHPRSMPFSGADLNVAMYYHVKEMRVVSNLGTYRFIRTKNTMKIPHDEDFVTGGTKVELNYWQKKDRNELCNKMTAEHQEYIKNHQTEVMSGNITQTALYHNASVEISKKYGWKYEFIPEH